MTTPPSRSPRAWNGEGEVLGVVPPLGAQARKEEAKVSLVAPEDVGPAETEAVILARPPDEPLVVPTFCASIFATTKKLFFFYCGWALFGNRVAGKRPRGSQCILNTG